MSTPFRIIGCLILGLFVMGLAYERTVGARGEEPAPVTAASAAEAPVAETPVVDNPVTDPLPGTTKLDAAGVADAVEPEPMGTLAAESAAVDPEEVAAALDDPEITSPAAEVAEEESVIAAVDEPAIEIANEIDAEEIPSIDAFVEDPGPEPAQTDDLPTALSEPFDLQATNEVIAPLSSAEENAETATALEEEAQDAPDPVAAAINADETVEEPGNTEALSDDAADTSEIVLAEGAIPSELPVISDLTSIAPPDPTTRIIYSEREFIDKFTDPSGRVLNRRLLQTNGALKFPYKIMPEEWVAVGAAFDYPENCEASAAQTEMVTVKFRVDPRGRPHRPKLAETTNPCFSRSAVRAVRDMRFRVRAAPGYFLGGSTFLISIEYEKIAEQGS